LEHFELESKFEQAMKPPTPVAVPVLLPGVDKELMFELDQAEIDEMPEGQEKQKLQASLDVKRYEQVDMRRRNRKMQLVLRPKVETSVSVVEEDESRSLVGAPIPPPPTPPHPASPADIALVRQAATKTKSSFFVRMKTFVQPKTKEEEVEVMLTPEQEKAKADRDAHADELKNKVGEHPISPLSPL
jgi:hypothetical protein